MTDERRVEVAAEALRADGWTCEYHEPTARRGECSGCDATLDASARAVVAALDAHDGDLRERLAEAVEHRRTGPGRCACGYDAYKVGAFFPDYHAMLTDHLNAAARTARGTT